MFSTVFNDMRKKKVESKPYLQYSCKNTKTCNCILKDIREKIYQHLHSGYICAVGV